MPSVPRKKPSQSPCHQDEAQLTYVIPRPDLLLDLGLDPDERATLREFTTMRRGHGERAVWIIGEIGGQP